jgi:apolipoprotein N-acyltransferase
MILNFTSEKKNNLFAFLAGSLGALAFAPFHFFLAIIFSLTFFFFLLAEAKQKKAAFWRGFYFGFGHFLCGIYWISIALLVDAKQFAWLIPFALTLIPAALALYLALFALSYHFFCTKFFLQKTYQKILLFSLLWIFFEALRATLFSGFPWNLLGYAWMFNQEFLQTASVFGVYGLSLLALFVSLSPALFLNKFQLKKPAFDDKIFASCLLLVLIFAFAFGAKNIADKKNEARPKATARLVQANVKQELKWDPKTRYENFLKHIALTNSKSLEEVDLVVWSETSVPYIVDDNPELLSKLTLAVPPQGFLITGALRMESEDLSQKFWNSVFVFDEKGVVKSYDKQHLVPFGEYVPLQKFFPFIDKITGGGEGFAVGDGAKTVDFGRFSAGPLICYEAIFSSEVLDAKAAPDFFVNLTNDAWFGKSTGPYQHFDMARMRAVEYGIPLIRVAGSGVSALFDSVGDIVAKTELHEEAVIDVEVKVNSSPTLYQLYGFKPLLILVLLLSLVLVFSAWKKK